MGRLHLSSSRPQHHYPFSGCYFKSSTLRSSLLSQSDHTYIIYLHSNLGQETAKGPYVLQVKLPPALFSTTHGKGFTLFYC